MSAPVSYHVASLVLALEHYQRVEHVLALRHELGGAPWHYRGPSVLFTLAKRPVVVIWLATAPRVAPIGATVARN